MIPFFVAELRVKNPCADIDPESWRWIFSGCWMFQVETWLAIGLCVTAAFLLASWWQSVNQKRIAA